MDNCLAIRPPRHGGNLDQALQIYGGQASDWLDLSTGISPWAYPTESIDPELWRKLPSPPNALLNFAAHYYGCPLSSIKVTPGTQLAIRLIPSLIKSAQRVAIPVFGYQEHRYAWQRAGHQIIEYNSADELNGLVTNKRIDHAVVINPNNPSCETISKDTLLNLAKQLSGLLVVDEAFADLNKNQSQDQSLSSQPLLKNILVLRSIGKFFGLAGARIGFVISHHALAQELSDLLCPWSINGAAQAIAERALSDAIWQQQQRLRVLEQNQALSNLLNNNLNYASRSQGLFTTLFGDNNSLQELHAALAEQRIWARLGDPYKSPTNKDLNWLRLSLPGEHFQRLAAAFQHINPKQNSQKL